MSDDHILVLADGGKATGLGHITRCSALAAEITGTEVKFLINGDAKADLTYEHCRPEEWADRVRDKICIVDSYSLSAGQLHDIWRAARACLWIDDENLRQYPGGIVVNPSLFGCELEYNNPGVRHLLGADYVILRTAFRRRVNKTINRKISELTVIMGGTDATGLLPRLVDELSEFSCKKNVIARNGHYEGVTRLSNLTAEQVAEFFLKSDLVVSAGGQTVNELIQLNTPAILVEVAENQRNNVNAAVKRGLAARLAPGVSLAGLVRSMDFVTRQRMCSAMSGYDFSDGVRNIVAELDKERGKLR